MPDSPNQVPLAYRRMLAVLAGRVALSDVARTAATLVSELVNADGASVTRVQDGQARYLAATGSISQLKDRIIPVGDSFTGAVVTSGEALIFDPRRAPASSVARARHDEVRSGLVCPIVTDGVVSGTIGVVSMREKAFDKEALACVCDFANFVALGLDRNRDQERLSRAHHFYRLGQLAGFVVDELDRPLSALMQSLRDARGAATALPEDARTSLEIQLMESFHDIEEISRVVSDLRMLATDDNDRMPVEIDVNAVLEKVAEYLTSRVESVAQFDVDIGPDLPRVRAVPGRLWQIVYAILVNAIEAVESQPRGMHRISLTARATGRRVQVSVEDTGSGIKPVDQPLIFEPFFTTRTGRQRAGLGLTLVWRYVDALGGNVEVSSKAGEGTLVVATIPIASKKKV